MGNLSSCLGKGNTKKKKESESASTSSSGSESSANDGSNSSNSSESGSGVEGETEKVMMKALLLGAGGVGKSTMFKIMTNKMVGMFSEQSDLREYKESIHDNLITYIKTVLKKCCELKLYTDENNKKYDCRINENLKDEVELILEWENEELNSVAVDAIEKLKKDEGFITCSTELNHLFTYPEGSPYYLEQLDRIWSYDYVPTFQDVLYCRDRTTGVTHEELPFKLGDEKILLDLYDVGGQRAERRAWKLIFNNVSAIFFVFSISEFNQSCIEDSVTNRMVESLGVLNVLNKAKVFKNTPILLIITKEDLLSKKLCLGQKFNLPTKDKFPTIDVSDYKPYNGDNTLEDVKKYVTKVCKDQMPSDKPCVISFKNLMDKEIDFNKELSEVLKMAREIQKRDAE